MISQMFKKRTVFLNYVQYKGFKISMKPSMNLDCDLYNLDFNTKLMFP